MQVIREMPVTPVTPEIMVREETEGTEGVLAMRAIPEAQVGPVTVVVVVAVDMEEHLKICQEIRVHPETLPPAPEELEGMVEVKILNQII